jgi:hypothetical protein
VRGKLALQSFLIFLATWGTNAVTSPPNLTEASEQFFQPLEQVLIHENYADIRRDIVDIVKEFMDSAEETNIRPFPMTQLSEADEASDGLNGMLK